MARIIKDHDQSIKDYITKDDIQDIKTIITEFVKVDPESFAFRYPKDKNGNKNLEGIKYINLRKLHDQMEILKDKLDKYYLCVSLLRDFQDEMRAEYGP
jgi:predicted nucleotidyltransferase